MLGPTGPYKYWRWKTLKDGTKSHICIDRFRLIQEDGKYGVPIKVTYPQGKNPYSTNGHTFNIDGWGSSTSDTESHWCSWNLAIIVMEFSKPIEFTAYKFETHSNPCTNDPQEWSIEVSTDGIKWSMVDHQVRDCKSNPIAREGYNEFSFKQGK